MSIPFKNYPMYLLISNFKGRSAWFLWFPSSKSYFFSVIMRMGYKILNEEKCSCMCLKHPKSDCGVCWQGNQSMMHFPLYLFFHPPKKCSGPPVSTWFIRSLVPTDDRIFNQFECSLTWVFYCDFLIIWVIHRHACPVLLCRYLPLFIILLHFYWMCFSYKSQSQITAFGYK